MVEADRCDHRELVRPGDRVGGVEQPPEPRLDDAVVHPIGEQAEGDGVGDLEEGRPAVPGSLHRLDRRPDPVQRCVDEFGLRGLAVELEPLAEAVDVGRQMGADPEPVRPEQARHERAHRALPRGACDVHGPEAILRMPQIRRRAPERARARRPPPPAAARAPRTGTGGRGRVWPGTRARRRATAGPPPSRSTSRLQRPVHRKTTVLCPLSSTRRSLCQRTARESASASASWPTVASARGS